MPLFSADIRQNLLHLMRMDYIALLVQMALLACGVLFIYNAGMDYGGTHSARWFRQLAWIVFGAAIYLTFALVDYRALGRHSCYFFLGGLILLCMVFLSGGSGDRSMLVIAGNNLQASEPMKAFTLLFSAWVLSHPILRYSLIPPIFIWGAIIFLPFGIITLQHDWGTALVFLPFSYAILFLNGMKKRWILYSLIFVVVVTPLLLHFMGTRQKGRLLVFLKDPTESLIESYEARAPESIRRILPDFGKHYENFIAQFNEPETDPDTENQKKRNKDKVEWDNWNAKQAIYSVGSGGVRGRGYGKGIQHTLGFLPRPVASTDFIFSVFAEETGFLGTSALLILFMILLLTTFRTALLANNPFGASIALGAGVLYATHAFINIGMCVEMAPIIGIPLPFVSYGGSCIVTMMMVAGMVQSVHIHSTSEDENALQDYL